MQYKYGMLLRPFSIGAQPKGVVSVEDANKYVSGYWDFITYNRKLSAEELKQFELEEIK